MNQERIKELYTDFQKALRRLEEALAEDLSKGNIVVDGTIQRFEFTFELAWKLGRAILSYNGIAVDTPRLVIKEAYQAKMIEDGQEWISMLEDRNKTTHIYDEDQAFKIYTKIKESYFRLLKSFQSIVLQFITQ
jgi:nucleotidyltransferase substrate binding protein (TIGR01987 family)